MAVVIETTVGDFTVDLFIDSRPQACKNFLKLCKMKYYNFSLFHSVQTNFLAQTGDPTGTGTGGESIYGLLYGENVRYFEAETMPKLKHNKPGLLSMVNCGSNMLGSQFFITLGEESTSLDGEHCVFGEISEGVEIVLKLNEAICDSQHRPYKDIRITHTIILEDPFDDPSGLIVPDMSPEATQERLANGRIGADEEVDETQGLTAEEIEEMRQEREAKARATILEIVGDLPDADMAPPENVLFVCKLNPVTTDDDLEIIFSRFGKVKSCEVIRDKNTGDSLQYAFVEFEDQKSCEDAYFKMDNVLIDDRRIHVDFSQSVAKMRWRGKGRGVEYFDNREQGKDNKNSVNKEREGSRPKGERSTRRERERDYDERDKRKDRGRDREEERGREKERDRGRESDDRHRRRDDRERSRSDWRRRDKRDHRDDDKKYEKRRETESSRKREDDSKRVSSSSNSSRRCEEKKTEVKRIEEKKLDSKEIRSVNGRSNSSQKEVVKNDVIEKVTLKVEKQELDDKEKGRSSKYNSPHRILNKYETSTDSFNDSQELPATGGGSEKSQNCTLNKIVSESESQVNSVPRRSSKDDSKPSGSVKVEEFDNERISEGRSSQKSDKKVFETKSSQEKKKSVKRKRKESESRKRKKRRHSSSSESSSESSDSSDSSSSSDSSDYKHGKRKKLIVAKKYYRGGKLVKEVKKKKRTKDTSDSESVSEESSDSDTKTKYKSKKHKKVVNVYKPGKKKSVHSSEDSQSESSSSDDSDERSRKRRKKGSGKQSKKKSKNSSKKKKRRKNESSSSSESVDSDRGKFSRKKQAKNLVTTTSE